MSTCADVGYHDACMASGTPRHKGPEKNDRKDTPSSQKPAPEGYCTRAEAADRCGVSVRTFQRWESENEVEGWKYEGEGPTARRIYPIAAIDRLIIEEAADEERSLMHSMIRESARSQKETAVSGAVALKAGADAIQGVLAAVLEENKRLREDNARHESEKLAVWELVGSIHEARHAELNAAALRERERIRGTEREDMMIEAFRMAYPGILHRLAPSKETEKAIIGMAFAHMDPESRADLMRIVSKLPQELQSSVAALVGDAIEQEAARKEAAEKKKAEGVPALPPAP